MADSRSSPPSGGRPSRRMVRRDAPSRSSPTGSSPAGTPPPAARHDLLGALADRPNLGCDEKFGLSGRMLRFSRSPAQGGPRYRFVAIPDGRDSELHVVLSHRVMLDKRLSLTSPALQNGARVFLPRRAGLEREEIFFVEDKRECVTMLRAYLRFLRRRNDATSRDLHARLTGMSPETARLNDALCLELFHLREESLEHVQQILKEADRKVAVIALDRGELLSHIRNQSGTIAEAARQLSPPETRYLVNVVRARYFSRIREHRNRFGEDSLTPFGKKLVEARPQTEFSVPERRMLMSLAIRADSQPLRASLPVDESVALVRQRRPSNDS